MIQFVKLFQFTFAHLLPHICCPCHRVVEKDFYLYLKFSIEWMNVSNFKHLNSSYNVDNRGCVCVEEMEEGQLVITCPKAVNFVIDKTMLSSIIDLVIYQILHLDFPGKWPRN